jgi:HD-like signal output (HDOD) protein/CheY-like chemotaxis protein
VSPQRILFVDDEPAVLEGLQNLLRKERRRWEMVFAHGSAQALEEIGKAPFDVVVSDMRMPGMDGAELLQRVKDRHPGTARIVLSGHAEQDTSVRALAVAHRFLSKPCDADTLRVVIERTLQLRALLSDDAVRRVIGRLDNLPSMPRTYQELVRATGDPDASIADVARIVEQDAAMSVKVLQIVNSAYFGLAQKMTSIQRAVVYLGIDLLKGLTLVAHVFSTLERAHVTGFSLDRFQDRSLLCARLAKAFVKDSGRAEEAFTAGLVHDIGKLIVAMNLTRRFHEIVDEVRRSDPPESLHAVETRRLGMSHAELGAYLLGTWGLPATVVEAAAFHHCPSAVSEGPCEVLAAVHVADALIDTSCSGEHDLPTEQRLDMKFLARAGLAARLPEFRAIAEAERARVEVGV